MTDALVIYVVCVDTDEARRIGEGIVAARLAACANILPNMASIYHWKGKIEQAQETVLLLKTRASLFEACAAHVSSVHSYATPCIIALPVVAGTADYLAWLMAETASSCTEAKA